MYQKLHTSSIKLHRPNVGDRSGVDSQLYEYVGGLTSPKYDADEVTRWHTYVPELRIESELNFNQNLNKKQN